MLIAYRRSENGKMQETADMQGADWVRVEKPSDEEIEKEIGRASCRERV